MIYVKFGKPTSLKWKDKWEKWIKKCTTATNKLVASHVAGTPEIISKALYSELKTYYQDEKGPFSGKCAYCESYVFENHPADLDHFRPKGQITQDRKLVTILDKSGKKVPHPGYYWLAYNWRNLLPSCIDCNRLSKQKVSSGIGKKAEFPVKGVRAEKQGDEKLEKPLLLKPTERTNFEKHFKFHKNGTVTALSKRAEKCIEVFGLNRQGLVTSRREVFEHSIDISLKYASASEEKNTKKIKKIKAKVQMIEQGKAPFSAAKKAGLRVGKKKYKRFAKFISS